MMFWIPVQAAEWSATPRIGVSTEYNDNVRLVTEKHDSVLQTNLNSSVRFGVAEQNQGLFGVAGFSIQRFTGGSGQESSTELNRENYNLSTSAYRNTLLDTFSVSLNVNRNSTLESELEETGNVINSRSTRQNISLAPSWSRTFNEKIRLNMSARYSELTFPDDPGPAGVESKSYSVSSNLSYVLTPLVSANLSANYSSFQPDSGFNSDSINLQAGISRTFSETLSTNWLAGWRETTSDSLFASGFCFGADPGATTPTCTGGTFIETSRTTKETRNTGLVYSVNISKRLESGSLSASASRSSNPTSEGELIDSTYLSVTGTHYLSSRFNSALNISYSDNETIVNSVGRDSGTDNSKLLTISPSLSWEWTRQLSIGCRYSYAKSRPAGTDKAATRNALLFSLTYGFRKFSVSR